MTKITRTPDGTVTFDLVIAKEVIAKEYQRALVEVAKTAVVKGFRPGKAPLKMVEAQTDKSQIYNHVLDHVLSPAYSEVIHQHKLVPYRSSVNPKTMEEARTGVMSVVVATTPEVKLGDYEKIVKAALKKHDKVHKHEVKKGQTPEDAEKEIKDHKLNVIFDALLDDTKFSVAPLLIEEETKSALSRLANQLTSLKLTVADYAKSIKKTTEELVAEYKKSAESNLRLEFILQKLIDDKKPEVSESELAELKPQKGQEAYAKYVIQKRKVLDFLGEL
jgi:FKBP-type peptidyl-prolyl cis-trans isomerase (trigger factor)